jgi:phenylacetate-CoA ligase
VLRLSPNISDAEIAEYYLKRMEKFGARFLHGYPSAIASFAHAIKKANLSVTFKLQSVLFASEAVYLWEREIVEEVFGCRVFSHYGNAEKVVLSAECEYSTLYHCLPQYGITEIDPETNEIIATSFLSYVNPFIRYRTTDVALLADSDICPDCGREYFPVFKRVEGRLEDFIVSSNGSVLSPAVITHPFKDLKTLKETQLIQKTTDKLILKAVVWENSDPDLIDAELGKLCGDLKEIIGNIDVKPEIVPQIERNKMGKFRWIISEVSKGALGVGLR